MTGRMDDGWMEPKRRWGVSGGFSLMASHFIHIHRVKGSERRRRWLQWRFIHAAPTQINTGQSEREGGRLLPAIT